MFDIYDIVIGKGKSEMSNGCLDKYLPGLLNLAETRELGSVVHVSFSLHTELHVREFNLAELVSLKYLESFP